MSYLTWNEKTISDFSEKNVSDLYDAGYVFTRAGKGVMNQTRSVRIDLKRFETSSENRRILKKVEEILLSEQPIPYTEYHWSIGKRAHDFYATKFGPGTFSAIKAKELLTDPEKSNFNFLLQYSNSSETIGHVISYLNSKILHYSYPFYDLEKSPKDMGLGMMTKAIVYAKEKGLEYVYLGSLQRPTDTYKLQFEGLEWFDGTEWQSDVEKAKMILNDLK
ncbi:MAG: hypothetical protein M3Q80_01600 [bacterium]|nr:hypothetical protein [bacterium]